MTIHTIEIYSSHLLKFIHSVISQTAYVVCTSFIAHQTPRHRASGTEPQSVHVIIITCMYVCIWYSDSVNLDNNAVAVGRIITGIW